VFYVVFGTALSGIISIIFSLLLPILGWARFFTLGPSFTLIMVGFITYAIVKYKLLNIEDFFSNGVLSLALIIFSAGTTYYLFTGNSRYLLPFYVVLANSFAGLFVISQNWRNRLNQIFCLLALCLTCWTLGLSTFQITGQMGWGKFTYVFASFIPAVFLSFASIFPKIENRTGALEYFAYAFGVGLAGLSATGLIIRGVGYLPWGHTFVLGPYYPLFVAYFVAIMLFAFGRLFMKYRRSSGISRIQIMYVFLGAFLSAFIGVTVAIVLPLLGFSRLYYLAPLSTLVMIGLIAYAMVKHRLMSIEVVIQRSTVYGTATVLIMALYALAVIVSEMFFRGIMGYSSLLISAFAALLIAVVYQPLVRVFQGLTDRLFFRGRYDYQKTLREISHKIASVIRIEELTRLIVSSFIDTMKVSEISFLLLERGNEHFRSVFLSLPRYKKIEIDVGSPIVSWLTLTKDILVRDEIEDEIGHQRYLGRAGAEQLERLEEVRDEMDRLGISIWVPIISKEKLIGIIALGDKLSGDVFTAEDIGLLGTLASQTAVALENARLYNEVVHMKDYSEKILESMVSGMLTVDNKGCIVTYNNMAEKILGRKTGEVIGQCCEEIWGKRGIIANVIENTLNQGKSYINFETNIASPERGLVPVSFSSSVLFDQNGKKMGALLTIQDLSEVKELENKVRQADKLSALATMATGMAHEIKNPLSSMKVLSQLLPIKIDDREYQKKLGEIMPREINRIDRIVESLLSFARATALKFEKTDINAILDENLKYFERQAKEAGIKIVKDYGKLPEIEVDRNQISQVISNLMLNAIQAMPEGGELRVLSFPGKKAENLLENVKVQITDTGHGIAQDTIKKLFDPFYTTKYGGTGLGLTITHSIVDGHKGYIDVESKLGKGTAFTVTLPVGQ
jgi:PAS domain S-box-containing protein